MWQRSHIKSSLHRTPPFHPPLTIWSICCINCQNCPKTWVTCQSAWLYVDSSWFICKMSMWTGTRPALIFNKVYFFLVGPDKWTDREVYVSDGANVCLAFCVFCIHHIWFFSNSYNNTFCPSDLLSLLSVDPVLAELLSLNFSSTFNLPVIIIRVFTGPK